MTKKMGVSKYRGLSFMTTKCGYATMKSFTGI